MYISKCVSINRAKCARSSRRCISSGGRSTSVLVLRSCSMIAQRLKLVTLAIAAAKSPPKSLLDFETMSFSKASNVIIS